MSFKRNKCPWIKIGEDTAGDIYWCEDCGAIETTTGLDERAPNLPIMPMKIDRDTLFCPDQGYIV